MQANVKVLVLAVFVLAFCADCLFGWNNNGRDQAVVRMSGRHARFLQVESQLERDVREMRNI